MIHRVRFFMRNVVEEFLGNPTQPFRAIKVLFGSDSTTAADRLRDFDFIECRRFLYAEFETFSSPAPVPRDSPPKVPRNIRLKSWICADSRANRLPRSLKS